MGPEVSPEQWGWPESRGLRMVFAEVAGGLCMQPGAAKERFARSPHNCAQGLYLLLLSVTQGLETVLTVPHAPQTEQGPSERFTQEGSEPRPPATFKCHFLSRSYSSEKS